MSLRASERLTLAALLALLALSVLATPPLPGRAAAFAALAAATVFLARGDPGATGGRALLRDLFPVAVVLLVFLLLEPVITGLNPRRYDAVFAAADDRWLGALVAAWRGAGGRPRALTDLAYLAYVSYYALPILAAVLARRRGPAAYEAAAVPILLAFYLSYAGYLAFPTSGPRVPAADEARLLGGGAFSAAVRAFLRFAESTQLDAFPSGHTAVALVSAAAGARVAPRLGPALFAWAAAIVFSTVYVHVHYAVDVVAGVALAALSLVASRALTRRGRAPRGPSSGGVPTRASSASPPPRGGGGCCPGGGAR